MTDSPEDRRLLQAFANLASAAGAAILACRGTQGRLKADGSPVCAGDRRAEDIIVPGIEALDPNLMIVSEESVGEKPGARSDRFVLIDPLDGTREFLTGSDDFTVNIALIEAGRPTLACLYAPALSTLWLANGKTSRYELRAGASFDMSHPSQTAATRHPPAEGAVALTSLNHVQSQDETLAARLGATTALRRGSSLKFALIADGRADIYPRSGRVMAWDIAAGQAILEAAGGKLVDCDGKTLDYRDLSGDWAQTGFVAVGDEAVLAKLRGAA